MLAKTDGTVFDSTNEYNSKVRQTQSQLFIYFSYTQKLNYSLSSMISIFKDF